MTSTLDSDTFSIVIDSEPHASNGTSQRSVCFMAWGPRRAVDKVVGAC